MKKSSIKVGDKVTIINPEFFVRCGYPMTFEQACKEVEEKFCKEKDVMDFLCKIGLVEEKNKYLVDKDYTLIRTKDKIIGALGYYYLGRVKRFGGSERKIYTIRKEDYVKINTDNVWKVTKYKMVVTGTYYPPGGGYNYYGEYDYEPGGLSNMEQHKILQLEHGWPFIRPVDNFNEYQFGEGWIEAKNVERRIEQ